MVYNTQNYWVYGLFPSPAILETRKHGASETASVSVLRWGGKTPTQWGPLERANQLNISTTIFSELIPYPQGSEMRKKKQEK